MSAACTALTAVLLSLCIDVASGRSQAGASSVAGQTIASVSQRVHLDTTSTLRDLLRHPAFAGFAPLLLPWDDRAYDEQLPLSRIDSLLPYHTHVDPRTVVAGLNRLIDDAADGKTVFYRFYSDDAGAAHAVESQDRVVLLPRTPRRPVRSGRPGRRVLVRRLGPRRLPVCRRDQRPGLQRVRAEVPRGAGRRGGHRGHGGGDLLHPRERGVAWCQHDGILALGKFGRCQDGCRHWVARGREVRRRGRAQAVSRGDGVHRAFGGRVQSSRPRSSWWARRMASLRRPS